MDQMWNGIWEEMRQSRAWPRKKARGTQAEVLMPGVLQVGRGEEGVWQKEKEGTENRAVQHKGPGWLDSGEWAREAVWDPQAV